MKPSAGLVGNVAGVGGIIAISCAIGVLSGNWWWTVLSAGIFCLGIAALLWRE